MAPQYITEGVITAAAVDTYREIIVLPRWKWLPCKKKSELLISGRSQSEL